MDLNTTRMQPANPEVGVCLACQGRILLAEDVCPTCGARQSALVHAIRRRGIGTVRMAVPRRSAYVFYQTHTLTHVAVTLLILVMIGIPLAVILHVLSALLNPTIGIKL